MIDKYNILNKSVFKIKNTDVLLDNILNDNIRGFDLEILIGIDDIRVIDKNFSIIIKNSIKKFKQELKYQLKKGDIDICKFNYKIFHFMNKIQLVHMLSKNSTHIKSEKRFGDSKELEYFAENMRDLIIDDNKIKLNIYKQLISESIVKSNLLKSLQVIDSYYSFYNKFLDDYSTYLVEANTMVIPKDMYHLQLIVLFKIYNKLYKLHKMFKSENYLINFKMKIINIFSEFLNKGGCFVQEFIINNPEIISNIYKMSEDINYNTDIFVTIFVALDKDNYLHLNLTTVFEFVIKLTDKLDKVKTDFIKKILMVKMLAKEDNINLIVDNIINGNISKKAILSLIGINDLTINTIHELIKEKITPLIINREITSIKLTDMINLFKNSKFNKLAHDLEIIQNDFIFSKFFTNNFNGNFNTNHTVFIVNPNFWAINFNEGSIEFKNPMYTLSTNQTCDFFENYKLINSSYNLATDDKRTLNILAHVGSVLFDYSLNNITKNIKMLPIQSMLFQLIYNVNSIYNTELIKLGIFNNYNRKFIVDTIDSMLVGGIIVKNKGILEINMNISDIKEDYIEILFGEKVKEIIKYKPVFENKTIVSCWINKFLKQKSYEYNDLLKVVKEKLDCGIVKISDKLFSETVDHMLENDYIEKVNNKLTKLFY